MANTVKKVFYLRENQVQELNDVIFRSYKDGKRRFNESSFCRVAIDLLLSISPDITKFDSEKEFLEACMALLTNRGI